MSQPRTRRRHDLAVVAFAACLSVTLAGTAANPLLMFPRMSLTAALSTPADWLLTAVTRGPRPFFFVTSGSVPAVAAAAALWWRRRFPAAVATVTLCLGMASSAVTVSAMIALFTVAASRPPRTTAWFAVAAALPVAAVQVLGRPAITDLSMLGTLLIAWTLVALAVGWGLFVRSRRMLVDSLTERARRAEVESARQVVEAQQRAREEIAREMHDVLAHRLSLLSLHAGALEFNESPHPGDTRRAAGVIRASAHQALEDLRTVIGVLRTTDDGRWSEPTATPADGRERAPLTLDPPPEVPQPCLGDLARLAEESRAAGMRLYLDIDVDEPDTAPDLAGRTVYRIVQEGLTNARKHAPSAPVHVQVSGDPHAGLDVIVRNPATANPQPPPPSESGSAAPPGAIPGSGRGLIGLAERAALAGGELRHGRTGADFLLQAWIPWPA
ncbi:sensor histidine kinase [Streptomyces sp. NPDC088097]|uniref:sensor histidine kinase n=1 Tax=Streptomyces sp. NPDC088097 TaxID=3365823 RepID=UPI00380C9138